MSRRWRASLAPLAIVALLCRCGGALPPQTPAPSRAPGAVELDEEAPAASSAPAGGMQASPTPGQPPPAAPPPPADHPAQHVADRLAARAELDRAQRELDAAASDCESACRALASMERATSHLCTLADEPEDQRRCEEARQRLTAARSRVRAACGECR